MIKIVEAVYYLKKTLQLARRGAGRVSPNPMVGAVVVKNDRILGEGYHRQFGGDHAEVNALRDAGEEARGATLYVNLEPCCHFGKTPPCTDAIIAAGIKRVVVGTIDPNQRVNGKAIEMLKKNGIELKVGVLEQECKRLNEAYFKFITTGLPLVTLKIAQSVDGRIATKSGNSRWITNEKSRILAHRLRREHDAILVGVGTVLKDDPQLTVRLLRGRNPYRIVLDSRLRTPLEAKILCDDFVDKTIIATTEQAPSNSIRSIEKRGAKVWIIDSDGNGKVNPQVLLRKLGERGISSLLVEGGREVFTSMLKAGLADRVVIFCAPILLGEGISAFGDLGVISLKEAIHLSEPRLRKIGSDFMITANILTDNQKETM